MASDRAEQRLRRLEALVRARTPTQSFTIQTLTDGADEADHLRQVAAAKRRGGYREGEPLMIVWRRIIDPPPQPRTRGPHRPERLN